MVGYKILHWYQDLEITHIEKLKDLLAQDVDESTNQAVELLDAFIGSKFGRCLFRLTD